MATVQLDDDRPHAPFDRTSQVRDTDPARWAA
jgi:hypothetical protein